MLTYVRILHYGAYHQGLHFLLRQKRYSEKEIQYFFCEITYNLSALNVYNGLFQAYCLIVSNPNVDYINAQKVNNKLLQVKTSKILHVLYMTYVMRESRKFCQRGSNFAVLYFFWMRGERIQIPLQVGHHRGAFCNTFDLH